MSDTGSGPADIIDFQLLDAAGRPALAMHEDGRDNVMTIQVENVSPQQLSLARTNGPHDIASEGQHHFALSFRPGTLSDETMHRLTASQPPMGILSDEDRADWDLRVGQRLRTIDPVTIYLHRKSRAPYAVMGPAEPGKPSMLRVQLHHIAASPGAGVRPTAVQLGLDWITDGARHRRWRMSRRAPLYVTHAGPGGTELARPTEPPFELVLVNQVAVLAASGDRTMHLLLSNMSEDTVIEGDQVQFRLDIGEEARWGALASPGEYGHEYLSSLTAHPVGDSSTRLEGARVDVGTQGEPNAIRVPIRLPGGRLMPGDGIEILASIRTSRKTPLAVHIESDMKGFGDNCRTFLFPRTTQMAHWDKDLRILKDWRSEVRPRIEKIDELETIKADLKNAKDEIVRLQGEMAETNRNALLVTRAAQRLHNVLKEVVTKDYTGQKTAQFQDLRIAFDEYLLPARHYFDAANSSKAGKK